MSIPINELRSMTNYQLKSILEDIEEELKNRDIKARQDTMTELYSLIEKIQVHNYDIVLRDIYDNELELNHICEVHDLKYDVGYTFGAHTDITGDDTKESAYITECLHRNDDIPCSECEQRNKCWHTTDEAWL